MEVFHRIPEAVAALIPCGQLYVTKKSIKEFQDAIHRLLIALQLCPEIGATDGAKEHPAIFHYFYGGTDIYICEYDGIDLMFGYTILNGDLECSEWGYTSLSEITRLPQFNIDYHFPVQTIEAALYKSYPDYFKKPQSLEVKSA
ncbi:MAG: hypothetical protein LBH42_01235 [Treponema sp.]|jgi:hypothetical protein|nr:hypothetical protein [Treponema sp.]